MKKYLAITAALALVLTACGHAAPDSTPTLTAATETTQATAAPAEPPQGWSMPSTSRLAMRALSAICPAAPMTAQPAPRGATAT